MEIKNVDEFGKLSLNTVFQKDELETLFHLMEESENTINDEFLIMCTLYRFIKAWNNSRDKIDILGKAKGFDILLNLLDINSILENIEKRKRESTSLIN